MVHYSSHVLNSELIVCYSNDKKFGNQMAFGYQSGQTFKNWVLWYLDLEWFGIIMIGTIGIAWAFKMEPLHRNQGSNQLDSFWMVGLSRFRKVFKLRTIPQVNSFGPFKYRTYSGPHCSGGQDFIQVRRNACR